MKNSGHKDAMETRLLACHRGLAKNSKWTLPRGFGFELQKCLLALGKGLITQLVINWNTNCPLSFGQKIEMPGMATFLARLRKFLLKYITNKLSFIVCMLRFAKNVKFRKVIFLLKLKCIMRMSQNLKKSFLTFKQHRQNKWKFSFKFLCPFQTTLDLTYLINCFQRLVNIAISDSSEYQNQN